MNNDARAEGDRPVALGTGLLALDVVYGVGGQEPVGRWAGGTCGNVLTILSCLGWSTYPLARLSDDLPARIVCKDLAEWGVHLDCVTFEAHGSSPVIIQYNRKGPDGAALHRFAFRCPVCGSRLPSYRPVPSASITSLLARVPDPRLFFFDRTSRGAIRLAAASRESGATVVFEPSSLGDPKLFHEALSVAHVVKFSHERWAGRGELPEFEANWLQVETMGKDGLRFRSRLPSSTGEGWQHVPGFPVDEVKDAAGSGDWCTAGIVAGLCSGGAEELWRATGEQLLLAFEQGQQLAAWNCGFEGARGGMYGESRRMLAGLTRDLVTAHSSVNLKPRRREPVDPTAPHAEPPLNSGCGSEHCHVL